MEEYTTNHINVTRTCYPVDLPLLQGEAERMRGLSTLLTSDEGEYQKIAREVGWKVSQWSGPDGSNPPPYKVYEHIRQITRDMGLNKCKGSNVRFYYLPGGSYLPNHIDYGSTCALNFVLSEQYCPVLVEGELGKCDGISVMYSQGLLNTSRPHGVDNRSNTKSRVIINWSIKDTTYEEVCELIPQKYIL